MVGAVQLSEITGGHGMKDWTEHHSGIEWPEGDNLKWQYMSSSGWRDTRHAEEHWNSGTRVRYREREAEMVKVFFSDDESISYLGKVIDRWILLAAPIAAYHKTMKYMACDADGQVSVCSEKHKIGSKGEWWIRYGEAEFICYIPKEAMPANWTTAIVELVHE
jgi:hypothetical protein